MSALVFYVNDFFFAWVMLRRAIVGMVENLVRLDEIFLWALRIFYPIIKMNLKAFWVEFKLLDLKKWFALVGQFLNSLSPWPAEMGFSDVEGFS